MWLPLLCLGLLRLAAAYFSHDGTGQNANPCTGQAAEMVAASMPLVVDLAKQAMQNNDEAIYRTWFGSCDRSVVTRMSLLRVFCKQKHAGRGG